MQMGDVHRLPKISTDMSGSETSTSRRALIPTFSRACRFAARVPSPSTPVAM